MKPIELIPAGDLASLEMQMDRWTAAEIGLERCTAFVRVMQGLCLSELRALHHDNRGGDRRSQNQTPTTLEFENWADYVKRRFNFSSEKARILIQMADAAKPRLRKLADEMQHGLGAMLDKPFSALTDGEQEALKVVTHKLTDGHSIADLQRELDLWKVPQGFAGGTNPKPTPSTKTREELAREAAQAYCLALQQKIFEATQEHEQKHLLLIPLVSADAAEEASLIHLQIFLKTLLGTVNEAIALKKQH